MRVANCDYYEIYCEDSESIINTMFRNLNADLDAGYNPVGDCIRRQQQMIDDRQKEYRDALDLFKTMTDQEINRWCYFELKKKGAIA